MSTPQVTLNTAPDGTQTVIATLAEQTFRVVRAPNGEVTVFDYTLDQDEPLRLPYLSSVMDDEGRLVLPLSRGQLPSPSMEAENAKRFAGYLIATNQDHLHCDAEAWAVLAGALAALQPNPPPAAA
jgi:hypothetical protein